MKTKKLGGKGVVVMAIVVILGLSFVPVIGGVISSTVELQETVETESDWNEGTLTNLTVQSDYGGEDDVLVLQDTETSGHYESKEFLYNDPVEFYKIGVGNMISEPDNSSINITVKTSDDGFQTIKNEKTVSLNNGGDEIDLSGWEATGFKFELDYYRDSTSVTNPGTVNATFGGQLQISLLPFLPVIFLIGLVAWISRFVVDLK